MKTELTNYEVFPRIVPADRPTTIVIRPLGDHVAFGEGERFLVRFLPMTASLEGIVAEYDSLEAQASGGKLIVTHAFPGEQEHYIRLFRAEEPDRAVVTLSVYSLLPDLFARRPLRGEFHSHSFRSDGKEAPAVVAANYRKRGYDFLAVTDHGRWAPSEEAVAAWRGAPIDLKLFHGEEVHTPDNHIHIINFGGDQSVNALARGDEENYRREVEEIQRGLGSLPEGVNGFEYAACLWSIERIRRGGGLSVFCHPHWIANVYHVRDAMSRFILRNMPFDAFELLGGQTVQENNMQVALYNDLRAEGLAAPVVGASDSHGTVNSQWFAWVSTVVFAENDSRDSIVSAVRAGYSAALEHYPGEQARAHGSYRLVSYALFLLKEYFPLHDELCFEEGRAMKDYICGDESAEAVLRALRGRTGRYLERCFGNFDR